MTRMKRVYFFLLYFSGVLECIPMSQSEIEDFSNYLEETSTLDQYEENYKPEGEYNVDENTSENAWESSGKFEGDLILNENQRRMILSDVVEGLSRNALTDVTKRWPNNELIYYITTKDFNVTQIQAIQDAINLLANVSCLTFRPFRKGDSHALVIEVGYQGGYQILNLNPRHPAGKGCFANGTILHELLHTLGFYHMQSSPDRDKFVNVMWQNIKPKTGHNFQKYNTTEASNLGVAYDYRSVMHYSRKAFSVNGRDTLVPKSGKNIGQRRGLSKKDIIKLNKMYCTVTTNPVTPYSTTTSKNTADKCAISSLNITTPGTNHSK